MQFVTEAFDAICPVLSPEEKGNVILQLASKLAGVEHVYTATIKALGKEDGEQLSQKHYRFPYI